MVAAESGVNAQFSKLAIFASLFVVLFAGFANATAVACPDLSLDGQVDLTDTALYAQSVGHCYGDEGFNAAADFDQSGCVQGEGSVDYACFRNYYGTDFACGESQLQCSCEFGNADINMDGNVDLTDVALYSQAVGSCAETANYDSRADFNGDGCVGGEGSVDFVCFQQRYMNSTNNESDDGENETLAPCPDVNDDGAVDLTDTSLYAQLIGLCQGDEGYSITADFDQNGCIEGEGSVDFACFSNAYGSSWNCGVTEFSCTCDHGSADIDNNGLIDLTDVVLYTQAIESCQGDSDYLPRADFDGNGCVGGENSVDMQCFKNRVVNEECEGDETAPVFSGVAIAPASPTTLKHPRIDFTVTDSCMLDTQSVKVTVGSGEYSQTSENLECLPNGELFVCKFEITLPDGTYNFAMSAKDEQGNEGTSQVNGYVIYTASSNPGGNDQGNQWVGGGSSGGSTPPAQPTEPQAPAPPTDAPSTPVVKIFAPATGDTGSTVQVKVEKEDGTPYVGMLQVTFPNGMKLLYNTNANGIADVYLDGEGLYKYGVVGYEAVVQYNTLASAPTVAAQQEQETETGGEPPAGDDVSQPSGISGAFLMGLAPYALGLIALLFLVLAYVVYKKYTKKEEEPSQ
jgi:hypothetical protein